jgi:hypothetical protein
MRKVSKVKQAAPPSVVTRTADGGFLVDGLYKVDAFGRVFRVGAESAGQQLTNGGLAAALTLYRKEVGPIEAPADMKQVYPR